MKLLYVSHVDTVVRMMLPHLDGARDAGFTVDVACNITRHGDDVRAHADTVFDLPFRRSPLSPSNLSALSQLTALIRERRYDVVHAHTPSGGIIGRIAATRAGVPVRVYTAHGFHFHKHGNPISNAVYQTIETVAGHAWSDGVIVINREDYETALARRVVPADRLFLTHGVGVSVDQFAPDRVSDAERAAMRAELKADAGTVVLTFVGEFIPRKRHADALRAFANLRKTHPNALLALGGDGKLWERMQELARSLGVADAVRFLGFRRDIPTLLAATDIFVFPSAQEGLPCSIQEAMCLELPVVCSAVRGNVDMVDDACGRTFPLGGTGAMADAIRELIDAGSGVRRELGRAGREKMVREYARPRCVAEWLDVYRCLLERAGQTMPLPRTARAAPTQAAR